jgi:hypothetical protein
MRICHLKITVLPQLAAQSGLKILVLVEVEGVGLRVGMGVGSVVVVECGIMPFSLY